MVGGGRCLIKEAKGMSAETSSSPSLSSSLLSTQCDLDRDSPGCVQPCTGEQTCISNSCLFPDILIKRQDVGESGVKEI